MDFSDCCYIIIIAMLLLQRDRAWIIHCEVEQWHSPLEGGK